MHKKLSVLCCCVWIMVATGVHGQVVPKELVSFSIERDTTIANYGDQKNPVDTFFSPNKQIFAFTMVSDKGYRLVQNGVPGPVYRWVSRPIFSPDSRRLAYIAIRGEKGLVVLDGTSGPEYDDLGLPFFSPDSQRLAYLAKRGDKWTMVHNGVPGQEYSDLGDPAFSPDSTRLAYRAKRGDKWLMVLDGVPGPEYADVGNPVFSPDSKRTAYTAKRGNKWLVVLDGVAGPEFDKVEDFTFSPDSRRTAYDSELASKHRMVVDGFAGQDFYDIQSPVFSPDSRRLAFVAILRAFSNDGNNAVVVVDGVQRWRPSDIYNLTFSPDSKSVVYKERRRFLGVKDGMFPVHSWSITQEGLAGPEFLGVGTAVFSADGKRMAYQAEQEHDLIMVVDGVPGKAYHPAGSNRLKFILETDRPVFSPDGRRLAYKVASGSQWKVEADSIVSPSFERIGLLQFSPDSRHLVYLGQTKNLQTLMANAHILIGPRERIFPDSLMVQNQKVQVWILDVDDDLTFRCLEFDTSKLQ